MVGQGLVGQGRTAGGLDRFERDVTTSVVEGGGDTETGALDFEALETIDGKPAPDLGGNDNPHQPPTKNKGPDAYEDLKTLASKAIRRARFTTFVLVFFTLTWVGGVVGVGIYGVLYEDAILSEFLDQSVTTRVMFMILVLLPLAALWLIGFYVRQAQGMFFQAETMRIQTSMLADPSNDALQRIQHVAKMLLEQMTNLGHVNNNASKKLSSITDSLKERTGGLATASSDTSAMLNSSLSDMQTLSERIEHVLRQVSLQGKSFEEMMVLADSVIKNGSTEMAGWQGRFKDVIATSDQAARDLARMQESLKTQLLALEEASVGVTAQSEKHLGSFRSNTMNILDEVGRVARKVVDEAKSLQNEMKVSAENLEVTARAMKENNQEIVASSDEKHERLLLAAQSADKYIDEMEDRMRQGFGSIEGQISTVTDRLEGVLKVLSADDSPVNAELKKFLTGIEQVTQRFTTQAANLVSASHVAAERSEVINTQLDDQRRDVFLKAARYLLQDMHSTSLDLTRSLGDEITDQELKRFMNGEASIFTQNLVSRNLGKLEREIVERLEVSKEARDYALRFMQQFERLLDDARQADPERILQASFVTSDIGKLYMVLCRASGRRPNRQLTSIAGRAGGNSQ